MSAIEFTAVAHDGVIDIPEPYRAAWNRKTVRVICLETDAAAAAGTVKTDDALLGTRRGKLQLPGTRSNLGSQGAFQSPELRYDVQAAECDILSATPPKLPTRTP